MPLSPGTFRVHLVWEYPLTSKALSMVTFTVFSFLFLPQKASLNYKLLNVLIKKRVLCTFLQVLVSLYH